MIESERSKALVRCGLVALALGLPRAAHGQDAPAAQALFDEAKKLVAKGAYTEACPKLEESQRLDPGIGTLFRLADCYERVGRTARAWSAFLEAAAASKKTGELDRERVARQRAESLVPKLCRVTITVAGRAPSKLSVTLGQLVVGEAQWGSAVPVDPGTYTLRATAPGKTPFETTVRADAAGVTAVVSVPPLADDPTAGATFEPSAGASPGAARAGGGRPDGVPTRAAPSDTVASSAARRRAAAVAVGVAGAAGLVLGGVFGVVSLARRDDAEPHCHGSRCDADGVDLRDSAIVAGNVSTAAFVGGAAALGGAAVLWLTAPNAHVGPKQGTGSANVTGARVAIGARPQQPGFAGAGLLVAGRF